MATGIASVDRQAEILKDQGNSYFKKERLAAAIEAYTEAITLCPNIPIYWTNRALCHRRRNDWERVEADCRKALELDKSSLKAHYMLGLALLQTKQYGEAIKQLEKALELGRGGTPANDMVEVIWQELSKAKYTEWEEAAVPRLQKQEELRGSCEKVLREAFNKALFELWTSKNADSIDDHFSSDDAETLLKGGNPYGTCSAPIVVPDTEEELDRQGASKISKLRNSYIEQKQTLADVFDKAAQLDRPSEVPEYLCCKITMDIFRDPVITPSGVTYERTAILDHLQKVGRFDPLTRASLQPEQLVSNLAIKEAVQAYLADHGWAYKTN